MAQERMSISVNTEIAAKIRKMAESADITVSRYMEQAASKDIDRQQRANELWAEVDELNRQAFETADKMTEEDMWGSAPPLSPDEERVLHSQLDAADALAQREGRP